MRAGSRPSRLAALEPGEVLFFPAPPGRTVALMSQIGVDARRVGVKITQESFIAIQPGTREVVDLVRVTRLWP